MPAPVPLNTLKVVAAPVTRRTRLRHCTLGAFAVVFSAHILHVGSVVPDYATTADVYAYYEARALPWASTADVYAYYEAHVSNPDVESEQTPPAFAIRSAAALANGAAQAIKEGSASLKEAAARLAEQHAELVLVANQAVLQLAEQKAAFVHAAGQAAAQLADQAAAQLAERRTEFKETASQAAAQLGERLAEGPAVLKAAAERVGEQRKMLQDSASETLTQLTDWKLMATEVASQRAAFFAEGVAEGQAALAEAATQAVAQFSEQHALLRDSVTAVGLQLSERQAMLTQAASQAAAQLTQFCFSCGQDALSQAATTATAQLAEQETLLRESATLFAVQLANLQATLSPSAGRIAAQLAELAELQQRVCEQENIGRLNSTCIGIVSEQPGCQTTLAEEAGIQYKAFALPYLLVAREFVLGFGQERHIAFGFLCVVACCVWSTLYTVLWGGGEDLNSLSYGSFVRRAGVWFAHRVFLGWALLLLSDYMEGPPLYIHKYDAMQWPMWSTLLPLSTQLCFFIPAAAMLNTAVARGSACFNTQEPRRFYASLSRECHAAIVGCFVSDWILFPTDMVFLGHHILGLGIIFGVWSMVIGEAGLLSANAASGGKGEANFWWVTGLAIASMEASSFFYNLYSIMSFGVVLNISLFAVFTYSNLLSLMCVLAQHPWGTSIKVIWAAGSFLSGIIERAQATFPQWSEHIPWWLRSKTTSDSVSYLWKSFMVTVICLVRHHQMWCLVREQLSNSVAAIAGSTCVLLAGASVWRLKDFERRAML